MSKYSISFEDLNDRLNRLLSEFCIAEVILLRQQPHEDAIVGELDRYLRQHFSDFPYNIHHNYQLMHSDNELVKKTVEILRSDLPKSMNDQLEGDEEIIEKQILPDVIFHDQTSNLQNFLIIEAKTSANKNKSQRQMDILKLKAATSGRLDYSFGVFIDFTVGNSLDIMPPFRFLIIENGEITYEQ